MAGQRSIIYRFATVSRIQIRKIRDRKKPTKTHKFMKYSCKTTYVEVLNAPVKPQSINDSGHKTITPAPINRGQSQ